MYRSAHISHTFSPNNSYVTLWYVSCGFARLLYRGRELSNRSTRGPRANDVKIAWSSVKCRRWSTGQPNVSYSPWFARFESQKGSKTSFMKFQRGFSFPFSYFFVNFANKDLPSISLDVIDLDNIKYSFYCISVFPNQSYYSDESKTLQ
jgi:hypothetical protein